MSDLEIFTPEPRIVTVRGMPPVEVLPIRVKQLSAFTKAMLPILPYAQAGDFVSLAAQESETAIAAVVSGTGLSREAVQDLYPDDLARLLGAVFEVNLDFFGRCILPAGQEMAARITETLGRIPSPASPASDAPSRKH